MDQKQDTQISSFYEAIKKLGALYVENAKLTVAEKTTMLLSAVAIFMIYMLLGLAMLVFLIIGIANLLESVIAPFWSYLIVAGVFAVMILVLYFFRIQLIYNPVARFISKLFINP